MARILIVEDEEVLNELEQIQRMLLTITIIFSVIAAIALYLLLSRLFKPLNIIAQSAKKIAGGQYNERIHIKGKHELATVALDFNRMAEQIESQILQLEDEATAKQKFVDNFAHEIRTPLTAIFGYAEYIQKAPITEETLIGLTQHIMNEAKHMENLGTSLLELATTRHYKPIKTTLSIPKLFEEVRQTLQKSLFEKQVQLILQPHIEKMEGQEDLIKSLLLNLVANAIKASHSQQGIIYLKAEHSKERIVIAVQDNGCGIPDTEISKIEEPFFRVDKARNRKDGGAGLGLSLCKQIIEVHQGHLFIESKLGEGTTIKVIF